MTDGKCSSRIDKPKPGRVIDFFKSPKLGAGSSKAFGASYKQIITSWRFSFQVIKVYLMVHYVKRTRLLISRWISTSAVEIQIRVIYLRQSDVKGDKGNAERRRDWNFDKTEKWKERGIDFDNT